MIEAHYSGKQSCPACNKNRIGPFDSVGSSQKQLLCNLLIQLKKFCTSFTCILISNFGLETIFLFTVRRDKRGFMLRLKTFSELHKLFMLFCMVNTRHN